MKSKESRTAFVGDGRFGSGTILKRVDLEGNPHGSEILVNGAKGIADGKGGFIEFTLHGVVLDNNAKLSDLKHVELASNVLVTTLFEVDTDFELLDAEIRSSSKPPVLD